MYGQYQYLLIALAGVVVATYLGYVCVMTKFSFARMRKKYIEDNDELDPEQTKKVESYYKDSWDVLVGLKWGIFFSVFLFLVSLYFVVQTSFSLLNMYFPRGSHMVMYIGEAVAVVALSWCYMTFGIFIPGAKGLVHALPMLVGHRWSIGLTRKLFYPFIKSGIYVVKKWVHKEGLPFRNEVNFTYTEDEIRCIVEESHRGGRLNAMENTLIKNAFDFFDLLVKDIMIPRSDIVAIEFDDSLDVTRRTISKTHHTRYPVCIEDKDDIIGFVHVKDVLESLLKGSYTMKQMIREILTVPEMMPAPALLQLMKKKRIYLAVVADEYGSTVGLVTLEDLAEELVGEIPQEVDDTPPEILARGNGTYEFDGMVILYDVSELLHVDIPEAADSGTIGGFLFSQLERIPKVGDFIIFENWKFTVMRMDGFRVTRVKAEDLSEEGTDDDGREG